MRPNGWRYPLVGGTRPRHFAGTNSKPRKKLENARPTHRQLHAVLGSRLKRNPLLAETKVQEREAWQANGHGTSFLEYYDTTTSRIPPRICYNANAHRWWSNFPETQNTSGATCKQMKEASESHNTDRLLKPNLLQNPKRAIQPGRRFKRTPTLNSNCFAQNPKVRKPLLPNGLR